MNYKQLAEIIISSLGNPNYNSKVNPSQEGLPRLLTFDLKPNSYCIIINKDLMFDVSKGETIEGNYYIINRLEEILINNLESGLEFIHEDPITKAMNIFTKGYVDNLVNKEETLGDLILNYFKTWYISKVGPEAPMGAEQFATENQTFSPKEKQLLNNLYIPIISISPTLVPVHDTMKMIAEISPLRNYILIESAYNVYGKRAEGVTLWVPRHIAKDYLQESEIEKVVSIEVVRKLLTNAGLFGGKPVEFEEEIVSSFVTDISKETIERFILDQHQLKEMKREEELKSFISSDVDVHDNKIAEDAKLPTFNI